MSSSNYKTSYYYYYFIIIHRKATQILNYLLQNEMILKEKKVIKYLSPHHNHIHSDPQEHVANLL